MSNQEYTAKGGTRFRLTDKNRVKIINALIPSYFSGMPQDREVDVYMSLADLLEFARSVEGQVITTLEVTAPSRRVEVLAQMAATVGQTADSVQNIDQSATWAVEFAQAILAKIEQAERQE